MIVPFVLLGLILALLIVEALAVRRAVNRIPLRILVNGARGKSSVTRCLAEELRNSSKLTLAKITGVLPTLLLPNGTTRALRRRGPARVQEQWNVVRLAAREGVDALVLECMSIAPELQALESRFFRPHIVVITNVRNDHEEQWGGGEGPAEALCASLHSGCTVVTAEERFLPVISRSARDKKCTLVAVARNEGVNARRSEISSTNAAVVRTVLAAAGLVPARVDGVVTPGEDPVLQIDHGGGVLRFVNGFSVNDVESAERFLLDWERLLGSSGERAIVLNTRSDRPLRSRSFIRWIAQLPRAGAVIVIGSHARWASAALVRRGFPESHVVRLSHSELSSARSVLARFVPPGGVAFGFGNIAGDGFAFLAGLRREESRAA